MATRSAHFFTEKLVKRRDASSFLLFDRDQCAGTARRRRAPTGCGAYMSIRNFEKLFRPRCVALIGASERPGSVGAVVARNLRARRV